MEEVAILIFGIVCFLFGWHLREAMAKRRIERYLDEMKRETIEDLKKDMINITVDFTDDGTIFVYAKEDGAYLAHGKTRDQLEDILGEKFPGKMFNATPDDLKKLEAR